MTLEVELQLSCLRTSASSRHDVKAPKKGRVVTHDQFESLREELRARMASKEGEVAYKKRAPTAETPFAKVKHLMGIRSFMRRGRKAVSAEWTAICAALNLRELLRNWDRVSKALAA